MADTDFDVSKGHRDWYGREAVLRNEVRDKLRVIFERYGFEPIETPLIEDRAVMAFKGGGEIQKEVYRLQDQGMRPLALRFDQTVPLARFVATHRDVKMPFKRYVIGPVFRDGPTQPEQGRFRSFTQCDVDTLGIKEMTAEAELMALANEAFYSLGLGEVSVKLNNRKLLEGILDSAGIPANAKLRTIVTLDKLDKIGNDGVNAELLNMGFSEKPMVLSNETMLALQDAEKKASFSGNYDLFRDRIYGEIGQEGFSELRAKLTSLPWDDALQEATNYKTFGPKLLSQSHVDKLMGIVSRKGTNKETLDFLGQTITSPQGLEGLKEVSQLVDYTSAQGFDFVQVEPSLARGLNYYTGTTLEVYLNDRTIVNSAILAGGRFDDMVGDFRGNGEEIPAVGFSFGLERLVMILAEKNPSSAKTPTDLYLIPIGTTEKCLKIAQNLRGQGLNVAVEMRAGVKVGKSTSYAVEKGIPYVGYVGESELAGETPKIVLKDLRAQSQETIEVSNAYNQIRRKK